MKKSHYQIIGILIIIVLTYLLTDTNYGGYLFGFIVGFLFVLGLSFIIGVFPRKKKDD